MDETQLKQIGSWFVLVLGALGTVFLEAINSLNVSLSWITFLGTTWYAIDYMFGVTIYNYFKVKKSGLKWEIKPLLIGIGIGILVIIAAFGLVFVEWVGNYGFSTIWTTVIGIVYYLTETLGILLIIHYFKIPPEDIPIEVPVLTEVNEVSVGGPANESTNTQ